MAASMGEQMPVLKRLTMAVCRMPDVSPGLSRSAKNYLLRVGEQRYCLRALRTIPGAVGHNYSEDYRYGSPRARSQSASYREWASAGRGPERPPAPLRKSSAGAPTPVAEVGGYGRRAAVAADSA
jgi:hypothetical protein